jgi:hypothetical protein
MVQFHLFELPDFYPTLQIWIRLLLSLSNPRSISILYRLNTTPPLSLAAEVTGTLRITLVPFLAGTGEWFIQTIPLCITSGDILSMWAPLVAECWTNDELSLFTFLSLWPSTLWSTVSPVYKSTCYKDVNEWMKFFPGNVFDLHFMHVHKILRYQHMCVSVNSAEYTQNINVEFKNLNIPRIGIQMYVHQS